MLKEIGALIDSFARIVWSLITYTIIVLILIPTLCWRLLKFAGKGLWFITGKPVFWTLRTVYQQYKDWREGRRRRKEVLRRREYGD